MSIFDEIGLAIGKGTEGIGTKAKIMRESSKLNFMAGEEEKKLAAYYQELGRLYADIHKNNYESEFAELMGRVEETRNNLIAYRRQAEGLKQTQTCPACNRQIIGDEQFCRFCGSRIEKNIISDSSTTIPVLKCRKCGAVLDSDSKYCERCGTEVKQSLESIEEQEKESLISYEYEKAETKDSAVQPLKCPHCGQEIEKGAVYCGNCGNKI